MPVPNISEAEWAVMEVLWARSPLSSTEVVGSLGHTTWSPTTVRTLLSRLARKKAVSAQKVNGLLVYQPRVTRDRCVREATESFVDRILGGSLSPLVAHFVEKRKISPEELADLKRLIREAEKKP